MIKNGHYSGRYVLVGCVGEDGKISFLKRGRMFVSRTFREFRNKYFSARG